MRFWLILVFLVAASGISASAQQAQPSATTSFSFPSQNQTGSASTSTSTSTSIPSTAPSFTLFNPLNSAPSRTIVTPSGTRRGASISTDIVCDFADFSGAYGNVVDVCSE
jgi:hypothetical protein